LQTRGRRQRLKNPLKQGKNPLFHPNQKLANSLLILPMDALKGALAIRKNYALCH
jgi:hypothetical protein